MRQYMLAVIKTPDQYADALRRVDALMDQDLSAGSEEANELEVLAVLVRDYERRERSLATPPTEEAAS